MGLRFVEKLFILLGRLTLVCVWILEGSREISFLICRRHVIFSNHMQDMARLGRTVQWGAGETFAGKDQRTGLMLIEFHIF
jgi:hypothetical protein